MTTRTFTVSTPKGDRVVTVREMTATQATLHQFDLARAMAIEDERERLIATVRLAIQLCASIVVGIDGATIPTGETDRPRWFDEQGAELVFGISSGYRAAVATPEALAGKSNGGHAETV